MKIDKKEATGREKKERADGSKREEDKKGKARIKKKI